MASGYLYNPETHQIPSNATASDTFVELQTANIDYSNLYIKNLDLNIKSSDLFNLFRKFGRIISARVMNNAQTGISKGFGFVSFSKPEEAYIALQEMNGKLVLSKHIIVAYHEPKKPRADRPTSTVPSTIRGIPAIVQHKMNPYPNTIPSPNVYDPGMSYTNTDMTRAYMPPFAPPPPPGVISAAPIVYRQEEQLSMQYPNQSMQMMMGYHPANASYPPVYPYNEDYVSGSVNRIVKKYSNNALVSIKFCHILDLTHNAHILYLATTAFQRGKHRHCFTTQLRSCIAFIINSTCYLN
jgi:RNA recognition motif-containing protein